MAKDMGIGIIGRPDISFKRNFRFTFQIQGFCGNARNIVPEYFVKTAARPSIDIDEVEINHLNGKTWIPGKGTWNEISISYYDVANTDGVRYLYNWLATVYNYADPVKLTMAERRDWAGIGVLNMYDGCGTLLEQWQLLNMFPKSINWGELGYEDTEISTVDLTVRYSEVRYRSYCPDFVPSSCCTPCGTAPVVPALTF